MGYSTLSDTIADLERHGQLRRIDCEISTDLEVGAIQRRVYQAKGPALLFTNVQGSPFTLLANLFGTLERARFLFRDALPTVERLFALQSDPARLLREPLKLPGLAFGGLQALPKKVRKAPVLSQQTTISELPQIKSWPLDGGAFITLPQVYSEHPDKPGWRHSNLGMYRVQLSGGRYQPDKEIGLHYQIHRGIGVHHSEAKRRGEPLRVNIFVGGPPALTLAAVMPLPEGLPEIAFAGLLGGRRVALAPGPGGLPVVAEADFCITGTIDPERTLPEGPFGDHLGYYSLIHDFPVLRVDGVYHRPGAIWPFTTVGRPPQEDTTFGDFIHELTGPLIPAVLPGVQGVHAVDVAGVHPLLLATGSERYLPYEQSRAPRELLTQANAILGHGQLSLAKFLFIADRQDQPPPLHDIQTFLCHVLARIDWRRDLHFHTRTTIDTLDYSGPALHEGSKVVLAASGPVLRTLCTEVPAALPLPPGFKEPRVALPGVLAISAPPCTSQRGRPDAAVEAFCANLGEGDVRSGAALLVLVDDSAFVAQNLENFLWVTFTRADPATDIYGVGAFTDCKHWGCRGPLVIDARRKPHHPPPLEADPAVEKRVDALGAPGGPLHGII
jgi:4-hydroxy-3-polyprenylbenzoate decarboxylase